MAQKKNDLFDFENLLVYQKSLNMVDFVYDITDSFPQKELYNLADQFKRASYSIALNIGEGSGGTRKEFIHFLVIARRSLRECVVCTTISNRRKYINIEQTQLLRDQLTEISKMISGLITYLESDKAKNYLSEPPAEYTLDLDEQNQTLPTSNS